MRMLLTLAGAPWATLFYIVSLVLLFLAAFVTPSADAAGPFYRRFGFGWAGLFFFVLAEGLR
jgi:hypothetical protein